MQKTNLIHVFWDEWTDYELLDSGNRKKLERFGQYVVIRGESKAWWQPELSEDEWRKAVAFHSGEEHAGWNLWQPIPREWLLRFDDLTLQTRLTATSKHIGVFPEKVAQWRWLREKIRNAQRRDLRILNLFAYTGITSLVAAAEGCLVTHVDSAKGILNWAKENQRLSGLENAPIRWILDDATRFVKREARRKRQYDLLILDPPSFGRGPKGEIWKLEDHLTEFLTDCRTILSDNPLLVQITMYALDHSALLIGNLLEDMMQGCGGAVEVGELAVKPKHSDKKISLSIFGQWCR